MSRVNREISKKEKGKRKKGKKKCLQGKKKRSSDWAKHEIKALLGHMKVEAVRPNGLKLCDQVRYYAFALPRAGIQKSESQVGSQLIHLYKKYMKLRRRAMKGKKIKPWLYKDDMDQIMIYQFLHRNANKGKVKRIKKLVPRIGVRRLFELIDNTSVEQINRKKHAAKLKLKL